MIDPGRLDQLVVIEEPRGRTSDGGGGFTQKWRRVHDAEWWVAIRGLQGSERQRAMQTQANATHEIRGRFRQGVNAKNRLVHQGTRVFKIVAPPVDVDEKHDLLVVLAREET